MSALAQFFEAASHLNDSLTDAARASAGDGRRGASSGFGLLGPMNYPTIRAIARQQECARPAHAALAGVPVESALLPALSREWAWLGRLACSCYGNVGATYLALAAPNRSLSAVASAVGSLVSFGSEEAAFASLAGLPPAAVLQKGGGAHNFPKFFVVVDERRRALVLCIRGTLSPSDVVTDVALRAEPFCGGHAHAGIAESARRVWAAAGPLCLQELAARPGFAFFVTGHSLGGATATLMAILVHRAGVAAPRCVSFAGPPAFAPISGLPPAVHAAVVNVVHRHDLVPCLTLHSLRELVRVCNVALRSNPSVAKRLAGALDLSAIRAMEPAWAAVFAPGGGGGGGGGARRAGRLLGGGGQRG